MNRYRIEIDAQIMTDVVADMVCDELISWFSRQKRDDYAAMLYDKKSALISSLCSHANAVYNASPTFRKKIKTKNANVGLDALYAFMRHWLSAEVKKEMPNVFRFIPSEFCMGRAF